MGSLFKAQTPAPPPPAPPVTVRDEINGVEQVPITNQDGSTSYITRKLPLIAEQQAKKDELDAVMNEAMGEIRQLSASDYTHDAASKQILDQWQVQQEKLLNTGLSNRAAQEEQILAKRGLADSSAGLAARRARSLDEQDSRQALELQRGELSNTIRGEKLALQQNLYNLASSQVDAQAAREAQASTRALSTGIATNMQRQASLLDYYSRGADNNPFSLFSNALGGSFGRTIGSAAGGSIGGPIGASIGGFLGSWLGGKK